MTTSKTDRLIARTLRQTILAFVAEDQLGAPEIAQDAIGPGDLDVGILGKPLGVDLGTTREAVQDLDVVHRLERLVDQPTHFSGE